jgi:hypothetical protein
MKTNYFIWLKFNKNKERLTVLLTTNATGTRKLKPIVIGKSINPRCFRNVNMSLLSVIYKSTPKAWMRSDIFEDWLRNLDSRFRAERRNILLLIDNAPSHVDPGSILDEQLEIYNEINDFRLTNIKIHFLPPNTTAHLQPMDAGIINNFKVKYFYKYFYSL